MDNWTDKLRCLTLQIGQVIRDKLHGDLNDKIYFGDDERKKEILVNKDQLIDIKRHSADLRV